jgi:hypothetical protein
LGLIFALAAFLDTFSAVDPSAEAAAAKMWAFYVAEAEKYDNERYEVGASLKLLSKSSTKLIPKSRAFVFVFGGSCGRRPQSRI